MNYQNLAYRLVNGVGCAANTTSLCMPFAHPGRFICHGVSLACNVVSTGIMLNHYKEPKKKILPGLLNLGVTITDLFAIASLKDVATFNPQQLAFSKLFSRTFEALQISVQFGNAMDGLKFYKDDVKEETKFDRFIKNAKDAFENNSTVKAVKEKLSWVKEDENLFKIANGTGILANGVSRAFTPGTIGHAACKATSAVCNYTSLQIMKRTKQKLNKQLGREYPRAELLSEIPTFDLIQPYNMSFKDNVICNANRVVSGIDMICALPTLLGVEEMHFSPEFQLIDDICSTGVQMTNLIAGIDPEKKERADQRAKIDALRPPKP